MMSRDGVSNRAKKLCNCCGDQSCRLSVMYVPRFWSKLDEKLTNASLCTSSRAINRSGDMIVDPVSAVLTVSPDILYMKLCDDG